METGGNWKQITKFSDGARAVRLGRDNAPHLRSRADAPRGKVLRLPLDTPELSKAVEIVPPSEAVVEQLEPAAKALYVVDLLGGPSQVRRFDLDGKNGSTIPIPPISSVQELVALEDGSLLFRDVSYTEPAAWFEAGADQSKPKKTALVSTTPVSLSDIEVTPASSAYLKKGRNKGPEKHQYRKGHEARWQQSDLALWLRRLWHQHVADLRLYPKALV